MRIHTFLQPVMMMITLAFSFSSHAQLAEKQTSGSVQKMAQLIASNYVDQDKAGQITSHLLTAYHRGDFRKAADWNEFNTLVTKSLQKFSGDQHIFVKYDPAVTASLKDGKNTEGLRRMNTGTSMPSSETTAIAEVKIIGSNLGYIKLSALDVTRETLPAIDESMNAVKSTDGLIIDLRDNQGGVCSAGPVWESYFLPEGTALLEINKREGTQCIDSTLSDFANKRYDKPVYILVNRNTASAAEALAFVLQQKKRAKVIGEPTAGAAFRNEWFAVDEENYISISTAAPTLAGTNRTWNRTGVQPDVKVKKGDALDYLLAALQKNK